MLLPWCVKVNFNVIKIVRNMIRDSFFFQRPKCVSLLQELCDLIRTDLTVLLSKSFSTIYPYLFINESATLTNQCIDYIITNTGNTLVHLLQSDIKASSKLCILCHIICHEYFPTENGIGNFDFLPSQPGVCPARFPQLTRK